MKWSRPTDLLRQLERLWQRGDLLRAVAGSEIPCWPLRLSFKAPTSAELTDHFEAVRSWVSEIAAMPRIRIEWREWTHRVHGRQRLPHAVWVETLDHALTLLDRTDDARRFQALWQLTATEQPALLPWLQRSPLQTLALAASWSRLLAVVAWLQTHPRPNIYLRQVDAAGVDSKFIETHRGTLTQWLDLALPSDAIEHSATGTAHFARRYGFRDKPLRIRLRLLDPRLPTLPGCHGLADITLDANSFATLALPLEQVFVTENEVNFLAFPETPRAIVVFGAGYGWEALARAHWLHRSVLHYWGDLDTHGFAILDSLRAYFPQIRSLLMDRATLLAHTPQWGEEPLDKRHLAPLHRLTEAETQLYDDLRHDRIHPQLRLEQERISYAWLMQALAALYDTLKPRLAP